ncbi:hypothetical protein SAMN05660772_01853 [Pasteurella testudinis DSM 23072]|uniref:Uncharacterized protein n=1 Tax=Pasteurella testudinis DSM 23072 TaxID=1122938 RepID=A0A1W1UK68_9PAST|nr:hypothetical protein [Pasteurella testudinis]SMB81442.1 hypothetical protein SAMN05660772_01853 [Pasteurella testudinis DSM 23072]SUB51411.1 Uncharacterised protein [Pasteurella testudinis]
MIRRYPHNNYYTPEFKQLVVDYARKNGTNAAVAYFDVRPTTVYKWLRQMPLTPPPPLVLTFNDVVELATDRVPYGDEFKHKTYAIYDRIQDVHTTAALAGISCEVLERWLRERDSAETLTQRHKAVNKQLVLDKLYQIIHLIEKEL